MKKVIYIFSIVFFATIQLFAEQDKIQIKEHDPEIRVLEERVKQQDEKIAIQLKSIEKEYNLKEDALKKEFEIKEENIYKTLNAYVIFSSIILSLIGFAINFFGRKAIKERVEQIIETTSVNYSIKRIDEEIAKKITDDYVSKLIKEKGEIAVEALLRDLEQRGKSTIKGIENKGEEAINSLLSRPPQNVNKDIPTSGLTEDQIQNGIITKQVQELFDLALKSTDSNIQIIIYSDVIKLQPSNWGAYNNRGVSYNNIYKYNEAIADFNMALKLNKNYHVALANRANSYAQMNRLDEAMVDVESSLRMHPNFEWAYAVKGNILTRLGKKAEALEALNTAIDINPSSAESYLNRGYLYEDSKQFELSEKDYQKALDLGIKNKATLYNNLAVLYRRKKEYEKAFEALEKAREYNIDNPLIEGTMALIYADKGDAENFYKHLELALQKGCPAWDYIADPGFDNYREEKRLKDLFIKYKK